ncbi:hypothetical protein R3W88_019750 [Solanum pinnatisectum]|uniref:X8 domain-containing protein n=1 Tax=Solanum pinnatisectum TaxID=50273 RepID=A0AAV9KK47_9SOLN|nr:hypothetical protein R3W88_019750 [Solanum pinnatisectum]
MLKDNGFQKVKLFDAHYDTLKGLGNSGIEVMVGIPNDVLATLGSFKAAEKWVSSNISVHLSDNNENIRYVAVGILSWQTYNGSFLRTTFPALQNVQAALVKAGQGNQVKVTVLLNADVYESSSSLLSGGNFCADIQDFVIQMLNPTFQLNMHSLMEMQHLEAMAIGGTIYTNMFDANHDTLVWALKKNGFGNLPIIVGEISWPTDGDCNANLQLAQRGKDTPMRPVPVYVYLFSLIDEDAKSIQCGNFKRHWGIFPYDGRPKYSLNLGTTNSGSLIPASIVKYLEKKWCVLKPIAKLDDPEVAPSVSYACARGDCTSLGYETSCGGLDARENISYAFNSYYQIKQSG